MESNLYKDYRESKLRLLNKYKRFSKGPIDYLFDMFDNMLLLDFNRDIIEVLFDTKEFQNKKDKDET